MTVYHDERRARKVARAIVPARVARSTSRLLANETERRALRTGPNPKGRLDILAYRVASEHALPFCEEILGIPGLAETLRPHAEALIAETIPAVNIFEAPKPRRRLAR